MTLQQLKYVVTVAEQGSISGAAKELFISQPSLTNAIKELEKEMQITIFHRTNKGIIVSGEGDVFLAYASEAFDADQYDFTLRETQTYEIIEDVSRMKSEIGILYVSSQNEEIIRKLIAKNDLKFEELFVAKPHVFISARHPLAEKEAISLDDLEEYPYLSFEQGEYNSFYFSEEILSTLDRKKNIKVRDRATLFNLVIGLNGYTVSSGVISKELNGENIIAKPLLVDEYMKIGTITQKNMAPSRYGAVYMEALRHHIDQADSSLV